MLQLKTAIVFLFALICNFSICGSNLVTMTLSIDKAESQSVLINVLVQNNTSKSFVFHELIKGCNDLRVGFPWKLTITKNGKYYDYPIIVLGAGKLVKVKRNKSYNFKICVDFEKFVRLHNAQDMIDEEGVNKDYGEYDVTLSYTINKDKSIKSNLLKISYKEF
jgi:hypothetical protein